MSQLNPVSTCCRNRHGPTPPARPRLGPPSRPHYPLTVARAGAPASKTPRNGDKAHGDPRTVRRVFDFCCIGRGAGGSALGRRETSRTERSPCASRSTASSAPLWCHDRDMKPTSRLTLDFAQRMVSDLATKQRARWCVGGTARANPLRRSWRLLVPLRPSPTTDCHPYPDRQTAQMGKWPDYAVVD